jgi:hypothetical protein
MNWHEISRPLQLKALRAAAITVAQLGRLVEELAQAPNDWDLLKLMLRRFHGLAAWSGLHGLAAIAVAAKLGEHDCSTLAAAQVVPQPAHLAQIRGLVDALRRMIYRQRTSGAIADEILWVKPRPESHEAAQGIAEEVLWDRAWPESHEAA